MTQSGYCKPFTVATRDPCQNVGHHNDNGQVCPMLDAPLPTDLRELLEEGGSALTEVDLGWHLVHRKIMPGCRIIETWLNQEGDRLTCERMEAHLCISLNGQSLMCS